ncbi:hypothetical protein QNH10_06715 [Sporosarcina thermotolerans]|uniref:hypothetical protein n=1 Tax=Sporosarcina thermotolerans TaxID=633404 RepID=UPI0024BD1EF4|nr:hypothetical protein [Sporosarcina thermotolerans]WHT49287.1 hypothetical protein QNH10_06715 [Sporosarcina thermotolerans]
MKGNMRGWLIGMAILLLLLSACSKDEKVGAEEKNPEPTENDEVEEVVEKLKMRMK